MTQTKLVFRTAAPPTARSFSSTRVASLSKTELVRLLQSRGDPLMRAELDDLKKEDLVARSTLPFLTTQEEADRLATPRATAPMEELNRILSANGERRATTKEDAAIRAAGLSAPTIRLDEDQRAAVDATEKRVVLHAGPGAGKTTTLCEIARLRATGRVLVLVFSRNAEAVMKKRFALLGAEASILAPKAKMPEMGPGVRVMTFDKYLYAMRSGLGDVMTSYDDSFMRGLGRGPNLVRESWDTLIIDEGQDVMGKHAALIGQLLPLVKGQTFIAGDPRQELFPDTRWFSDLVGAARAGTSSDWTLRVLRRNYRSHPDIVDLLNAFSRTSFPSLHEEQVAARSSEKNGAVAWSVSEAVGSTVGRLLAARPARSVLGLTPVSLDKWNMGNVIDLVKQTVFNEQVSEGKSGRATTLGGGTVIDASFYWLGTARLTKGAERDHVVLFGLDAAYLETNLIAREALVRMFFVALSRARDSLSIVLAGPVRTDGLIACIAPDTLPKDDTPTKIGFDPMTRIAATNLVDRGFWGHGQAERAVRAVLDSVTPVSLSRIEILPEENQTGLRDAANASHVTDSHVVGKVVEASIGHLLGFNLGSAADAINRMRPGKVVHGHLEEITGLRTDDQGQFQLVYDPRFLRDPTALQTFKRDLFGLADEYAEEPHYLSVVLDQSASIGKIWTVSERLADLGVMETARPWAGMVLAEAPPEARWMYQKSGSRTILLDRSAKIGGSIEYKTDFETAGPNARVVEIKHTQALEAIHAAQALIYATCLNKSGVLVGTHTCQRAVVAPMEPRHLDHLTRAFFALTSGVSMRNILGGRGRTRTLPGIPSTGVLISLDVETTTDLDGTVLLTEIGAVALDFGTQDLLVDVYHAVAPGVVAVGAGEGEFDDVDEEDDADGTGAPPGILPRPAFHLADQDVVDPPFCSFPAAGLAVARGRMLVEGQRLFVAAFEDWVARLGPAVLVQWAGSDTKLLGLAALPTTDMHKGFRWWLEQTGTPRVRHTRLTDAVECVFGPEIPFAPHRAFEDAVMTAAVLVAVQHNGLVV